MSHGDLGLGVGLTGSKVCPAQDTCLALLIELNQLFSEVGDLKRYSIHYDRSGRSKDVMSAVKRYNNVQLDGKPVEIEIVGTNIATPAMPPAANGSFGNLHGVPRRYYLCFNV
ncbi:LOW QUALITY PROTEIN: hypothetical protein CsSME_00016419 [Camellia sinensis var. sinensis]